MKPTDRWPILILTILSLGSAGAQGTQSYLPPNESLAALGNIATLLRSSHEIDRRPFVKENVKFIGKLPSGELFFESGLNLDDDGDTAQSFPKSWRAVSPPHQRGTALRSKTGYLNPMLIPYIVLPGSQARGVDPFYKVHGIRKGDGAIIIWKDTVIAAVFGDVGPENQLGEASLAAILQLDPSWSPFVRDPKVPGTMRTANAAYPLGGVLTIVFPGSSQGETLLDFELLKKKVLSLYANLRGSR